ncbi:MAG: hypothetical protein JO228_15410 [Xanthobacteraceae bacterium]|nr:hypothetical protein [Xanthobacteraceae bacterium]
MPEPDIGREIDEAPAEPLLPIEKKLVGWSLGIGLVLLAVLVAINHFAPISALN